MQILFNIFPRISLHCKLVPMSNTENTNMVYYILYLEGRRLSDWWKIQLASRGVRGLPRAHKTAGQVQSSLHRCLLESISLPFIMLIFWDYH